MSETELKQKLLNIKKIDRTVFTVISDSECAVIDMAKHDCEFTNVFIPTLLIEKTARRAA